MSIFSFLSFRWFLCLINDFACAMLLFIFIYVVPDMIALFLHLRVSFDKSSSRLEWVLRWTYYFCIIKSPTQLHPVISSLNLTYIWRLDESIRLKNYLQNALESIDQAIFIHSETQKAAHLYRIGAMHSSICKILQYSDRNTICLNHSLYIYVQ